MEVTAKNNQNKRYASPAVLQAGRILSCLAQSPSPQMSLADISTAVHVSGSKAFAILEALQESGLVKRGKNGKGYSLGPGLITLSRKVLDDLAPSELAVPILERLTEETQSSSVFGIISGDSVFVAAKKEIEGDVRISIRIGHVMPLAYGAHGKAIIAFLPESEQDRILKGADAYFHERPPLLDRSTLMEELDQCRRDGFVCGLSKTASGLTVVTAPVLSPAGHPVGFVEIFSFSAPEQARELGPFVAEAGKALSREMGAAEA